MAFQRPNLATLLSRVRADISSRLPGADPSLRRSMIGVLADIQAGTAHGIYGYLDWMALQLHPFTATNTAWIEYHASTWLQQGRKAATAAKGILTFTGNGGSTIPASTVVQRSDGGQFTTDAELTLASSTGSVACTATIAGISGNTDAASPLALVSPIATVSSAVSSNGISNGFDAENDAALKTRYLARIKEPAHGGNATDYITWANEVAGVTRAWVYPNEMGLGTVTVRFVSDQAVGGLIPDAAKVAEVLAYMDARCPVQLGDGFGLYVVAPVVAPLNPTIQLIPNDLTTQAAVTAELNDLLSREAVPGGTILLSHINEAISIATGETNHVLISPVADVTNTVVKIATLGTITWQ